MAQPVLQVVLERLAAESERLFGTPEVRLTTVETAEREASTVARVSVSGGDGIKAVFVKVFKPKMAGTSSRESMRACVVRDFEVTSRLYASMASYPPYQVVRPLICFPEQLAVVTAEAEGETLSRLVERRARWWPSPNTVNDLGDVLSDVGGWLRAFQATERFEGCFSLDEMRAYIDVRLRRLLATNPPQIDAERRRRILMSFDRTASVVDSTDLREVLTHADLAPSNVLVNGRNVTVIDFAMVARGSIFMDVTRLYSQLEFLLAKPWFHPTTIRELQRCLVAGFDPTLQHDRPLFRLFLLQHLLCHMSNLARNPAPPLTSLYNRHQLRLHQRWLRALAAY